MKREIVRAIPFPIFVLAVMLSAARPGQAQEAKAPYPSMAPAEQYRIADLNSEIALVRSAAPGASAQAPKPKADSSVYAEPAPIDFGDHTGYTSLFDGKTLTGWDGRPGLWRVEGGAIVGETIPEKFPDHAFPNTFLINHGVEARDFDLKLEIKVEKGGGSGIQYRSSGGTPSGPVAHQGYPAEDPRWVMFGPQADFWYPVSAQAADNTGQLYSQNTSRGAIVLRGQVVQSLPGKNPQQVSVIGDRGKLAAYVKDGEWNQYMIIARGGVIVHILNGQLMAVLIDDDPASSNSVSGLFGLQLEGVPCKVSFRNLWLKKIN